MNNELMDIDRLHKCITAIHTGQRLDRQEGATTARLMMLLGDIEVGEQSDTRFYAYVSDNQTSSSVVKNKLSELLAERGCVVTQATTDRITVEDSAIVRFVTANQFFESYNLRGIRLTRVYFDVSPRTLVQYEQECINHAMNYVRSAGADVV